jgi:hypothetical protein
MRTKLAIKSENANSFGGFLYAMIHGDIGSECSCSYLYLSASVRHERYNLILVSETSELNVDR